MKTLLGFALGTLLSVGTMTPAFAAGTTVAAPAQPAGIEVIVVTAKRPAPFQPVAFDVAQPIPQFIVTGKRPAGATNRTPPAMAMPALAIEMPKVELAVAQPSVIRL